MKLEEIPVEKIKIGERYRTDPGDLEGLAANIHEMGLLVPIGVDSYYELIYGGRRLDACAGILGWKNIPAVVLSLDDLLAGQYAENEFRKDFDASERIAIGEAIERKELRKQQGKKLPDNTPEVSGVETRDLIAKRTGFRSSFSMRQARRVVKRGASELIVAMDQGKVSISAADAISSQPEEEQKKILQMPKNQQHEVVRRIRKTRANREADQQRARDLQLFRGLYDAVKFIAMFYEEPAETWAGLWRVSGYDFAEHLDKASEYLHRLQRTHPNEARPRGISR